LNALGNLSEKQMVGVAPLRKKSTALQSEHISAVDWKNRTYELGRREEQSILALLGANWCRVFEQRNRWIDTGAN
jgi:hypothetical protein